MRFCYQCLFIFMALFPMVTTLKVPPKIDIVWPALGDDHVLREIQSRVWIRVVVTMPNNNNDCIGDAPPTLHWGDIDAKVVPLSEFDDLSNISIPVKVSSNSSNDNNEVSLQIQLSACSQVFTAETFFILQPILQIINPTPMQIIDSPDQLKVKIEWGIVAFKEHEAKLGMLHVRIDDIPWSSEPIHSRVMHFPIYFPFDQGNHRISFHQSRSEHFVSNVFSVDVAMKADGRPVIPDVFNKDVVADSTICACFLSCQRTAFLIESSMALLSYIHRVEPSLSFKMLLVDNGSGPKAQTYIETVLQFDMSAYFRRNRGIAHGFNALFFGMCNSPYILSLEDDWKARESWPQKIPILQQAIRVLQHDPIVLEVHLRDFQNKHDFSHNRSAWLSTGGDHPVYYRRQCHNTRAVGHMAVHGTYTNGASLKRRSSLVSIGSFRADGEYEYSERVNIAGYCSAHICLEFSAEECGESGMYGRGEEDYIGLFEHIGRGSSPGFRDFGFLEEVARHERFK